MCRTEEGAGGRVRTTPFLQEGPEGSDESLQMLLMLNLGTVGDGTANVTFRT